MYRSSKYICKKVIILMLFIIYLKCVLNLNLFALMSIYVTKELMLSLFACSLELMNRRDFPPFLLLGGGTGAAGFTPTQGGSSAAGCAVPLPG